MASAGDSSDSELKIERKYRLSAKKAVISSSDEGDNDTQIMCRTPTSNDQDSGRRHSQRKRRNTFSIPSKEKQWSAISTCTTTNKLSLLKPRKLVNDFTKVTNRYNYDHLEVSGEESMEEFLKDTDSPDSSETDDNAGESTAKRKRQHRVKGYRPRIADLSNSSDEEENVECSTQKQAQADKKDTEQEVLRCDSTAENTHEQLKHQEHSFSEKESVQDFKSTTKCITKSALDSESDNTDPDSFPVGMSEASSLKQKSKLDSDSDDSHAQQKPSSSHSLSSRKARKLVVVSSNSEDEVTTAADSQEIMSTPKKRKISALDSDTDSDSGEKKKLLDCVVCPIPNNEEQGSSTCKSSTCLQEENIPSSATGSSEDSTISESCGDSESGESSDGDDTDSEHESRIQKLAAAKIKKKESLFGQLKSARARQQTKT